MTVHSILQSLPRYYLNDLSINYKVCMCVQKRKSSAGPEEGLQICGSYYYQQQVRSYRSYSLKVSKTVGFQLLFFALLKWFKLAYGPFWQSTVHSISTQTSQEAIKYTKAKKQLTMQMFTGIYRVFTGKSECRDFKFMGIACYLQSL